MLSEPRDAAKTSRTGILSSLFVYANSVLFPWCNDVRFGFRAKLENYAESHSMLQSPSQGMSAPTGGGWAQLRQQTRALEGQTEAYFHKYSQYSSATNIPTKPTDDEKETEAAIQELLDKREAYITQLTRLIDSESPLTTSALKANNLTRHREILLDHRRELARLSSQITENRSRANLLSSVRSDISAYRSSNPEDAEAEYMLDERRRIDNSHSVADGVLSQAYAINEQFGVQRETIASVNRRIVSAASQVPGINSLIGRIGAKKRRDGIVLGGFIAFCFLVLFFFM